MRIPVFVSCPTSLSDRQARARKVIDDHLKEFGMEPRALGRSDYPTDLPLREVFVIAKHCSGGVILGFEQLHVTSAISKRGTRKESKPGQPKPMPTPWNNLEAGILFGLKVPLLVFKEEGIDGGVFDEGTTDAFVHRMPMGRLREAHKDQLRSVLLKWQAKVREHYYRYS